MFSHLVDALLANGHQVIGIDSLIGGCVAYVPSGVDVYSLSSTSLMSKGCDAIRF